MKKIGLLISLMMLSILCACTEEDIEKDTYSLMVPNGSTSIAQVYMESNKTSLPFNYDVERVSGPESLTAAFTNESHDFIIAPSVLGAKLYQTGVNYKLVGTVSYGNLFLVSSSQMEGINDLKDKDIVAFGQLTTPDIILKKILDEHGLLEDATIDYVSSSQATLLELIRDDTQIVLMSEPFLSNAKEALDNLNVLNLSQLWESDLSFPNFPQAALYANNDLSDDAIVEFTFHFQAAIDHVNNHPDQAAQFAETLNYPIDSSIIESSIPNSQLMFKTAMDARTDFESFYQVIFDYNKVLIGSQLPGDDYYRNWDSE
ncbi:MAG: ABC transporter substrate-binding protein [Candidatus Izemoplasmataceae bacterium]